ncbi:helix-turn-helix domain-containing protein [Microbacterium sp. P06]|uniref:helix-turn-helix domain-containing protein n=1 Tax=unclassified Microbacterium TaxID=2609290 RepID=UPI00374771CA
MKISDTVSATSHRTLQGIAEQLAVSVNRPVVIREQVSSEIGSDGMRTRRAPASKGFFEVPVESEGAVVAHIVLPTNGQPSLTAADFQAIDAASALVRNSLLADLAVHGTDRESVLRDLLSDDQMVRRAAFSRAVMNRWLHREQGTVVRALIIDNAVSDIQRVAFARQLAHLRPVPSHFLTLRAGMVMLVGQPADSGYEGLIFQEAAKRSIRILGIGSASPSRGADDLRVAADEAAIAASLAAALPQFHPVADASELGGWLLLASASANPAQLHVISPAAHALYSRGDENQRVTIETYLDVGANVVSACQILFVHRTTLYYRLERMPEVVKSALNDGIKRSTLHMALKLIRLWEATGRV